MTRGRLALALWLVAPLARAADPEPMHLIDRIEAAWQARDVDAYLDLWEFESPVAREREAAAMRDLLAGGDVTLSVSRPGALAPTVNRLRLATRVFQLQEPRASVEQWMLTLERRPDGWLITGRDGRGRLDGLVHLSLDPSGYRADGLVLRLPDFELSLDHGTLFTTPAALGPTLMVFVGEGQVHFRPQPVTEQQQLKQFCGRAELTEPVRSVFVRIHPGDLSRVLGRELTLVPDPAAAQRLGRARETFAAQANESFLLDTPLPASPWWLLPGLGDALVTFDTRRRGEITYTINEGEPEAVSLFDRKRRRQICLYSSIARRYSEDASRVADVLHHDLSVRFEPTRFLLSGEDSLRLNLRTPSSTLRLRLDDALRVTSLRSSQGDDLLFFRVRQQSTVVVSIGSLGAEAGEIQLTIRYAGALVPGPIEREVLQVAPRGGLAPAEGGYETVVAYTNRNAWYPQLAVDNYATATLRLDVPEGFTPVTGGLRGPLRTEAGRSIAEYRLDEPAKYMTVAIGRLLDLGTTIQGPLALTCFSTYRARSVALADRSRALAILAFLSEQFGPAPYPNISLLVMEGQTPGGHSPPGMVLLTRRPPLAPGGLRDDPGSVDSHPDFFLAHELAHQWWGHGIAGENYHERWLSEGAAQYAATLWVRHSRGEDAFRSTLAQMGRWARSAAPEGPISLGYRLGHLKGDPQVYRAVVYDKGAYVLHMLRGLVGDASFDGALRSLQTTRRFTKIGSEDLRQALETASGRDLGPYFRHWVDGTDLPVLRVSHQSEAAADVGHRTWIEIRPQNLPGPFPVQLTVFSAAGRETRRVTLDPSGGRFEIDTRQAPTRVQVNDDLALLAEVVQG